VAAGRLGLAGIFEDSRQGQVSQAIGGGPFEGRLQRSGSVRRPACGGEAVRVAAVDGARVGGAGPE